MNEDTLAALRIDLAEEVSLDVHQSSACVADAKPVTIVCKSAGDALYRARLEVKIDKCIPYGRLLFSFSED